MSSLDPGYVVGSTTFGPSPVRAEFSWAGHLGVPRVRVVPRVPRTPETFLEGDVVSIPFGRERSWGLGLALGVWGIESLPVEAIDEVGGLYP